jgi:DHA1 family tetracycline resistance protein-like MFS transporter
LSVYGFAVPAFVAAGFSLLALLGVIFFLPESLSERTRADLAKRQKEEFSLKNFWKVVNRPRVGPLLNIRFFYGLAFSTFSTIFPLYALYKLELDAQATGYVLTYVGILVVFVQGYLVGRLADRYWDRHLILVSLVLMTLSLLAWAVTPNLIVLLIVLVPLAFSGGTLNTILNSALSKSVYPEEVGGTLGLSASLESLTRVISPTAGGYLLGSLGTWAPGVASAIIMTGTVAYAWRRLIKYPDPPLPVRPGDEGAQTVEAAPGV